MDPSASNLALLHDHYKESFALIRCRERQRDRLFLSLLLGYALLILEIQYPANANGVIGSLMIAGNAITVKVLPLNLLLDASWVLVAALVLKYCQLSMTVERQYPYLHLLEDRMSDLLEDDEVYRREGRAYLSQYPRLLGWAWTCYTIIFPAGFIVATVYLLVVEVVQVHYNAWSLAFDALFAVITLVSFTLYRLLAWPPQRAKLSDSESPQPAASDD